MGYLIKDRIFVSELTAEEIAECRRRAQWLADTHFQVSPIESFDLGNLINGYMTAEITTSYVPGQRRIWYYLNKHLIYTQRVEAGQGARRTAEDYYAKLLNMERSRERQRSQPQREGV